jgi:hypothetical protein
VQIIGQSSGMGSIRMEFIDSADLSISEQIAQGLNFPAAMAGALLVESIDYGLRDSLTGAERELFSHMLTAILIPGLWYLVIKKTIFRNRIQSGISSWIKAAAIAGMVFLSISAILILFSFWIADTQPQIVSKILSLIWISWGLYILGIKLRKQPLT